VPVVARGAGTSLSGGALPDKAGVVLSLAKFRKVLSIDALARTAVVQPGRAQPRDLGGRGAVRALLRARSVVADRVHDRRQRRRERRRRALPQVRAHRAQRAARARLPDHRRAVEFGGASLDSAGYDLLALVNGSEGLLAVMTEITVKLLPKPQYAQVACAAFDDLEKRGRGRRRDHRRRHRAGGLEMMDRPATRAVEAFVHAGYPLDAAAVLLVESDGTHEEVDAEMGEIRRVLSASGATSIRVSRDEKERPAAVVGDARPRSRRSAASRPITTASTARSRGRRCRAC
jgi:glycolate oxidase